MDALNDGLHYKVTISGREECDLVICDRLLKIAHFMATIEETSAEELARLFRDNM